MQSIFIKKVLNQKNLLCEIQYNKPVIILNKHSDQKTYMLHIKTFDLEEQHSRGGSWAPIIAPAAKFSLLEREREGGHPLIKVSWTLLLRRGRAIKVALLRSSSSSPHSLGSNFFAWHDLGTVQIPEAFRRGESTVQYLTGF